MRLPRLTCFVFLAVSLWMLPVPVSARDTISGFFGNTRVKTGIGYEYFMRTIDMGEDKSSSLSFSVFLLDVGAELGNGILLRALIGYATTDFDSIVFHKIPLSVEVTEGEIAGLYIGADATIPLFTVRNIEIKGYGQFVYYSGKENEWEIPGLSVEGSVTGRPKWWKALAGTKIVYAGLPKVSPYVIIGYSPLKGEFSLEQRILSLMGQETKKITAKQLFNLTLGLEYEFSDQVHLLADISAFPGKKTVDYGAYFNIRYSFGP